MSKKSRNSTYISPWLICINTEIRIAIDRQRNRNRMIAIRSFDAIADRRRARSESDRQPGFRIAFIDVQLTCVDIVFSLELLFFFKYNNYIFLGRCERNILRKNDDGVFLVVFSEKNPEIERHNQRQPPPPPTMREWIADKPT
jgi:hypothetical protein